MNLEKWNHLQSSEKHSVIVAEHKCMTSQGNTQLDKLSKGQASRRRKKLREGSRY